MVRRYAGGLAMATAAVALWLAPAAGAATRQATARGSAGAAATVDPLATRAAIQTLRKGGNATDAAIAAAAVLGVVEPYSCGIGGGGFWISYNASRHRILTLDSREKAPAAMRPDSFMENGRPLGFDDARFSGLSIGVPGTLANWQRALNRSGTMTLREVLQPAIRIARRGFVVDQTFYDQTAAAAPYFDDVPSTRAIYLDADGTPRDVGTRVRNPDLARTYALIARRGIGAFYGGRLANAMAAAAQNPPIDARADHVWRHGLLTADDLAHYRVRVRPAAHSTYHGLDVYGIGPPSSGGSTVAEILNIVEGFPAADETETLHRFIEASRYAFADRNAYLADPSFFDVPLAGLLSKGFAGERRAHVGETAAAGTVAPGNPYDDARETPAGRAADYHPGQSTTNMSIADSHGDTVEYTFTIESTGGAGIVVPGYGFLLNNELTDFNYDSTTHPNRPEPGKRPRSSIAPTLVFKDGRPYLAVGSPGGATIITTVAQILLERLELRRSLPQSIAAPRLSQRNSSTTQVEPGFEASPLGLALAARGQRYAEVTDQRGEIGAATGIEFRGRHGLLAAAEPVRRGGGSAMVVTPRGTR